jgi:hypothetical protein
MQSWLGKARYLVDGVVYEYDEGSDGENYTKAKQVPEDRVVARISGSWRGKLTYTLARGDDTVRNRTVPCSNRIDALTS